jgi:hypothetical protein
VHAGICERQTDAKRDKFSYWPKTADRVFTTDCRFRGKAEVDRFWRAHCERFIRPCLRMADACEAVAALNLGIILHIGLSGEAIPTSNRTFGPAWSRQGTNKASSNRAETRG